MGIYCTSVCESKDPSVAARLADAVSRPGGKKTVPPLKLTLS